MPLLCMVDLEPGNEQLIASCAEVSSPVLGWSFLGPMPTTAIYPRATPVNAQKR